MPYKFFVGIDVAKKTLDIAILQGSTVLKSFHIDNTKVAISNLLLLLKVEFNATAKNTLFCAERMGIFTTNLLSFCQKKKISICMESPLRLKLSLGIARGKSDKIDAIRIAQYVSINHSKITIWQPARDCIKQLQNLSTVRKRLVRVKVALMNSGTLEKFYLNDLENKSQIKLYSASLEAVKADIKNAEKLMISCISKDPHLSNLYKIITSIPHLGNIIAVEILIATNEFKSISCPKKFASYCGIAPFEWSSGTSIKGRTRVSHIANKEIKTLLHLAAIGYTRRKESVLGKYYIRKVGEGKNKMSVLNAIRNKLVQRIFACVKQNEVFTEDK